MDISRIALDVMGGDNAPDATVEGALRACDPTGVLRMTPDRIVLVGDTERVRVMLDERGGDPGFVHEPASEVIGMDEKPARALRAKPDSSIAVGVRCVREGRAGSFVSMGNTGAVVGASTLGLGTLAGVRRAGIAVTHSWLGHPLTVIDMGANIAPKAENLFQYAVMGSVYTRDCLGIPEPRVGLLNIGNEANKGTDVLKNAHGLLAASDLRFVGNLEGDDFFRGLADVLVTDGFTGNVVLKLMEGFAGFMLQLLDDELTRHDVQWGGEALATVRKNVDYAEYGGALLLGVAGVVVIGHGRSDGNAVANALSLAARALDADVNEDIVQGLAAGRRKESTA